jgi:hypothetical protein
MHAYRGHTVTDSDTYSYSRRYTGVVSSNRFILRDRYRKGRWAGPTARLDMVTRRFPTLAEVIKYTNK